jgi:hypothetical protein
VRDIEPVMKIATRFKLAVIEDNAHSLGADCSFSDGTRIALRPGTDCRRTAVYRSIR